MGTRIFIHGLEGSNMGTKARFFRERFPDMIIPNFTGTLTERMENLRKVLSSHTNIQMVGSSFGGLMAYIFAMENESLVDRLILLAPAINLLPSTDYPVRRISTPTWIFHGINDMVIPIEEVKDISKRCFSNLTFEVLEDDHLLQKNFKGLDWDHLLGI